MFRVWVLWGPQTTELHLELHLGFGCWVLLRGASEFTELTGGDSSSMLHTSLSDDSVLVVVSISHAKVTKAEERQHQDNRKGT